MELFKLLNIYFRLVGRNINVQIIQDAGISGLSSKTLMIVKIMLQWMRGRNMLKLFCQNIGFSKKFLLSTLPEEPQTKQLNSSMETMELKLKTEQPSTEK